MKVGTTSKVCRRSDKRHISDSSSKMDLLPARIICAASKLASMSVPVVDSPVSSGWSGVPELESSESAANAWRTNGDAGRLRSLASWKVVSTPLGLSLLLMVSPQFLRHSNSLLLSSSVSSVLRRICAREVSE